MLPQTNALLDRASLIPLPPVVNDRDAEDVVTAFRKVRDALAAG